MCGHPVAMKLHRENKHKQSQQSSYCTARGYNAWNTFIQNEMTIVVSDIYCSRCEELLASQEGRCFIKLVNWQSDAALVVVTNRNRTLQQ